MTPMILVANAPSADNWWWQALTSHTTLICLAWIIASAVVLILGLRTLWRLGRTARLHRHAAHAAMGDSGAAMMEFALVLPVMLFFSLVLAQSTTVLGANFHVHYAAFAAARTAIVQIPMNYVASGEPSNTYIETTGSFKHELIRQAAVYAVAPISGRTLGGKIPADQYASGLSSLYTNYGKAPPAWINNLIASRLCYADAYTQISVLTVSGAGAETAFTPVPQGAPYVFGPVDPVAVEVTHRLNLSLPIARYLFATGHEGNWFYCTITARSMLTNQGVSMQLPPTPPLDRNP